MKGTYKLKRFSEALKSHQSGKKEDCPEAKNEFHFAEKGGQARNTAETAACKRMQNGPTEKNSSKNFEIHFLGVH